MILRRLTQSIRNQDWLAVVLEVAIVVVGIFVGLQVDDWNENRITAARQEALLEELLEDLRADVEEIDSTLKLTSLRFSAAESLVSRVSEWHAPHDYPTDFNARASLETPETISPTSAKDALFFAQRYSRFSQHRRTYDALLAAGDLTFVNRPNLATKIRSFYALSESWITTELERQVPITHDLSQAFSRHGLAMSEDIDWDSLDAIVANDPELVGILKKTVWEAAVQNWFLKLIRARTLTLISEVEETQ